MTITERLQSRPTLARVYKKLQLGASGVHIEAISSTVGAVKNAALDQLARLKVASATDADDAVTLQQLVDASNVKQVIAFEASDFVNGVATIAVPALPHSVDVRVLSADGWEQAFGARWVYLGSGVIEIRAAIHFKGALSLHF